jgi:hypothetical protein
LTLPRVRGADNGERRRRGERSIRLGACHEAAGNSNERVLALVIAGGADVNCVDALGSTPCHSAASDRNESDGAADRVQGTAKVIWCKKSSSPFSLSTSQLSLFRLLFKGRLYQISHSNSNFRKTLGTIVSGPSVAYDPNPTRSSHQGIADEQRIKQCGRSSCTPEIGLK